MKMVATIDMHIQASLSLDKPCFVALNFSKNQVLEINKLDTSRSVVANTNFRYSLEYQSNKYYLVEDTVVYNFRPFVSASIQVEPCKNLEDVNSFLGKIPPETYVGLKVIASGYLIIYKDLGDTVL